MVSSFSKLSAMRFVKINAPILFFIVIFLTSVLIYRSDITFPVVSVKVGLSSPIITSQFSTGMTLVDTTLNFPWGNNDLVAVKKVKSLMKKAIRYIDTPTMAWGSSDPWPDPSQAEPGNWSPLDSRLQLVKELDAIPV